VEKARGAEQRVLGSYSLNEVELATDSRGRPVTSMCVSMGEVQEAVREVNMTHANLILQAMDFVAIGSDDEPGAEEIINGEPCVLFQDAKDEYKKIRAAKGMSIDRSNVSKDWRKGIAQAVELGVLVQFTHRGNDYLKRKEICPP
jgi:hypothetical protein